MCARMTVLYFLLPSKLSLRKKKEKKKIIHIPYEDTTPFKDCNEN